MMKTNLPINGILSFFLFLSGTVSAVAQSSAKRCDLSLNQTPAVGSSSACLDLVSFMASGSPLVTAANATRIGTDGFRFCKNAFESQTASDADIVFVYDNSGSMYANYAWIPPGSKDTTYYYYVGESCTDTGDQGTFKMTTANGTRDVKKLRSNSGCKYLSGDPYEVRGAVVKSAIDYMAAKAPHSTAGVLDFAQAIVTKVAPVELDQQSKVDQLKAAVLLADRNDTYYGPPLDQAHAWLKNPALSKNPNRAIVFISDGAPDDRDKYLAHLDTTIRVFSIFLGQSNNADTLDLKHLSDTTGGAFYRVDPKNPKGINEVMQQIVHSLLYTPPKSIILTNASLTPPQISRSVALSQNGDGSISMMSDSILALKQGRNELHIKVEQGDATLRDFTLTVDANGPEATAASGNLKCFDPPSLVLLNAQGTTEALYSLAATSYTLQLERGSPDSVAVMVNATSANTNNGTAWGDAETFSLPMIGLANGSTRYRTDIPFSGMSASAIAANGKLETSGSGTIRFEWKNPRDPREFASYSLEGNPLLVVATPVANPSGKAFTTLDPAFLVTLTPGEPGASIFFTADGSLPDSTKTHYSTPIPIESTTTLKAISYAPNKSPSPIAVFVYTESEAPKVASPIADPPGSSTAKAYPFFALPLQVNLSTATPGADLFYSIDGAPYVGGRQINLARSGTLKTFGTKAGMYPSDTSTFRYEYFSPTSVYVRSPNGRTDPGRGIPSPESFSNASPSLVIIGKSGSALPGNSPDRCPTCWVGGVPDGTPFGGPLIIMEIPGPVEYQFSIFSTLGEFLVGGTGRINPADLTLLEFNPKTGNYLARLVWLGRSAQGTTAGTGAYVLRSVLKILDENPEAAPVSVKTTLLRFGVLR